jgi:hypothetical protein
VTKILNPTGDESIWVVEIRDAAGHCKQRDIFAEHGAGHKAKRLAEEYRDAGFKRVVFWDLCGRSAPL